MRQVRRGMFETNSSSSHSIVLSKSKQLTGKILAEDGRIVIRPGEFGWGVDRHTDAYTKASYCLTAWSNNDGLMDLLRKVIEKHTGMPVTLVTRSDDIDSGDWGYIDHQSIGMLDDVVKTEEDLERFIFGPSTLIIDNDNH